MKAKFFFSEKYTLYTLYIIYIIYIIKISPAILKMILFIYFWLCWVFAAAWPFLSGTRSSCGAWASHRGGCSCGAHAPGRVGSSCRGFRALQQGSVMVPGLSCSTARGIFLDQGSNPCLLRLLDWKADSFTTVPPGEPSPVIFYKIKFDQLAGK